MLQSESSLSVENLSFCLVREFLARKKLKKTLTTLYEELNFRPDPTTTNIISSQLGITTLLQKNKLRETPLTTLTEIIVAHLISKASKRRNSEDKSGLASRMSGINTKMESEKVSSCKDLSSLNRRRSGGNKDKHKGRNQSTVSIQNSQKSRSSAPKDKLVVEDIDMENDIFGMPTEKNSPQTSLEALRFQKPSKSFSSSPMKIEDAIALRELLFGKVNDLSSLGRFHEPWTRQGFCFIESEKLKVPSLAYGLVQHQGGPCGILAVVQAYIAKNLLFGSNRARSRASAADFLCASDAQRRSSLHLALCEILWQTGDSTECKIVLPGNNMAPKPRPYGIKYVGDGFTETLNVFTIDSFDDLKEILWNNLQIFEVRHGRGVLLLLYSAMLSRGLKGVVSDMDFEHSTLIGAHGYCSQESVNLLLIGRAFSNVFDNEKKIDDIRLRGPQQQSAIGFLTLMERFGHVQVGSNLKDPLFPIWVVCSESHYTTLSGVAHAEIGPFDLFYYDQLANQDEEIRLTVDPSHKAPLVNQDLIPPLEDCIRTKWSGAIISWNGVDPLL